MPELFAEAMRRAQAWFDDAQAAGIGQSNAIALATVDATLRPAVRFVLLKGIDARGFTFFTNLQSRKAQHIADNAHAAFAVHWDALGRQINVEGAAEAVTVQEADEYWRTRPRESQLGAWASMQSQVLDDRAILEARFAHFDAQFGDSAIPRPAHWSGYRLLPTRIELWTTKPYRLHERICYQQRDGEWHKLLLNP